MHIKFLNNIKKNPEKTCAAIRIHASKVRTSKPLSDAEMWNGIQRLDSAGFGYGGDNCFIIFYYLFPIIMTHRPMQK